MLTSNGLLRIVFMAFALCVLSADAGRAEVRTWVNPGDGSWGEPTNWSGGVVPGEEDTAIITGNVTVTLRTYRSVQALQIDAGATLALLGDGASVQLTVSDSLTNNGAIRMFAIYTREAVVYLGDSSAFTNNGEVRCLANGQGLNLIEGRFDNFGQVIVEAGSTLTFRGDVTQFAGTFSAVGRAKFDLGAVEWRGGCMSGNAEFLHANLLVSGPDAEPCDLFVNFVYESRLLANLSSSARINVGIGKYLRVASGAQNAGGIVLRGGQLVVDGPEPLVSSGSINAAVSSSIIYGEFINDGTFGIAGGARAVLSDGRFVQRAGLFDAAGVFDTGIVDVEAVGGSLYGLLDVFSTRLGFGPAVGESVIDVLGANCVLAQLESPLVTIRVYGAPTSVRVRQSMINASIIQLRPGAALFIDDSMTLTNVGRIESIAFNANGGAAIRGRMVNAGTIAAAPQTRLSHTGGFVQTDAGVYSAKLEDPNLHSRFVVFGAAQMGGQIRVELAPGYEPELDDEFDIFSFGSGFDTLSCDDIDGLTISDTKRFKLVRTATTLSLVVVDSAELPADTNCDCASDLIDLATVLSNFGTPTGMQLHDGDFNADGSVDLTDLGLLLATFGTACP